MIEEQNIREHIPRGRNRPLSIAPMMKRTDRHYRFLMRQLTRETLLYTEMVTTGALLFGHKQRYLDFHPMERPLALQLGGDDPEALALCARMGEDHGYDEINLNVGCPSDRVQKGRFGACLMAEPERVAEAVVAMRAVVNIPVTVKHRIGIDHLDRYEDMLRFVDVVTPSGCDRFTVHARKAWLSGLSPKQNRTIPPLRYEDVHRLKAERQRLMVEINGGFRTLAAVQAQLEFVDAVMIGRAAYEEPMIFAGADRLIFGDRTPPPTAIEACQAMVPYAAEWLGQGGRLHQVTRHMHHLFNGTPGARLWRRRMSEIASKDEGVAPLEKAISEMCLRQHGGDALQ